MKQLILVRGLPGSGKSTFAKSLQDSFTESTDHFEADQFFMHNGEYKYDFDQLHEAHAWCQRQTEEAMRDGIKNIIVSNTFCRQWEMDAYKEFAKIHGYQVFVIAMPMPSSQILFSLCVHKVPLEKIALMRERWEP